VETFSWFQDPRKTTPSKKTHPNWKIDPFLAYMQNLFKVAWKFGQYGSCDEQDIGFTEKHTGFSFAISQLKTNT
jgi:hypothetical protein